MDKLYDVAEITLFGVRKACIFGNFFSKKTKKTLDLCGPVWYTINWFDIKYINMVLRGKQPWIALGTEAGASEMLNVIQLINDIA